VAAREARARCGKPELADIVRVHGAAFRAAHRLCAVQHRALRAIERCRTAALGGELRQCDTCGTQRYVYHSCRNRHCPKCQTRAKERWLADRRAELLPVPYYHLVFTLPHELNVLAQANPRELYAMLFAAASQTLIEFGRNPRWLGGEIAASLVLHTWGQTLSQHLHVHCLVAAGALDAAGQWVRSRCGFLFPVKALSAVFRGKFLAALGKLPAQPTLLAALRAKPWVVYAKRPFAGPAGTAVPRPLHPPHGDLQRAARVPRGQHGALSLQGLRPRRAAQAHESVARRVSAPLRPSRAAAQL